MLVLPELLELALDIVALEPTVAVPAARESELVALAASLPLDSIPSHPAIARHATASAALRSFEEDEGIGEFH